MLSLFPSSVIDGIYTYRIWLIPTFLVHGYTIGSSTSSLACAFLCTQWKCNIWIKGMIFEMPAYPIMMTHKLMLHPLCALLVWMLHRRSSSSRNTSDVSPLFPGAVWGYFFQQLFLACPFFLQWPGFSFDSSMLYRAALAFSVQPTFLFSSGQLGPYDLSCHMLYSSSSLHLMTWHLYVLTCV